MPSEPWPSTACRGIQCYVISYNKLWLIQGKMRREWQTYESLQIFGWQEGCRVGCERKYGAPLRTCFLPWDCNRNHLHEAQGARLRRCLHGSAHAAEDLHHFRLRPIVADLAQNPCGPGLLGRRQRLCSQHTCFISISALHYRHSSGKGPQTQLQGSCSPNRHHFLKRSFKVTSPPP